MRGNPHAAFEVAGAGNVTMVAGLRATAKVVEHPPEPKVGAPVLDPTSDSEFGAVASGFGFMFVPDKPLAFREAWRVLKPNGILLFNVWDGITENPHVQANMQLMAKLFPDDAEMQFKAPYEMNDHALLYELVTQAGFGDVRIENHRLHLRVPARTIAEGQIRGTPRSLLIEQRGVALETVVEHLTSALASLGGVDPYEGRAQAVVVEARKLK